MAKRKILVFMTDVGFPITAGDPINNTIAGLCGVYRALEREGHEPWLLVNDVSQAGSYRAVDHSFDDFNFFDELLMNRQQPNFYGGNISKYHLFTLKALFAFEGQVAYYYCDPDVPHGRNYVWEFWHKLYELSAMRMVLMKPVDLATIRSAWDEEEVKANIRKCDPENLLIRTSYPIAKCPANRNFKNTVFIDAWREAIFRVRPRVNPLFSPSWEELDRAACYVGSNKPSRHKRLTDLGLFSSEAEKAGLIKYYGNFIHGIRPEEQKDTLSLARLLEVYDAHVASLVIGHRLHADTGIQHRFLQGLVVNRGMLVDSTQDRKRMLTSDEFLHDALYFEGRDDYEYKLKKLGTDEAHFNEVVRRVNAELKFQENETAEEFVRRVNAS